MTPFRARAVLLFAMGAVLATVSVPKAFAVEEHGWFSLEAGANLYDAQQALRDGPGYGLRAAWFLNRFIGVEGLASFASPDQDPVSGGGASVTHFGGGLVLTPDRYTWVLPYLYGGLGSVSVDRDGQGSKSSGAMHGGAGAVFRVGERIGIRLDARDLSYKQEGGPGRDTRVNDIQIATGITAFWFGRPRDTDEDGVPDKRDKCPDTPRGARVDANGCPIDSDGDGVFDGLDKCSDTPKGVRVDADGCPMDSDGDGVFDGPDKCPDTPKGAKVDADGCPMDSDGDGVPDGIDICPFTPPGVAVNAGGCPIVATGYERQLLEDWVMVIPDLQFAPDSSRLLPEGMARVDSIAAVIQQWPMLKFEIGIHTDDRMDEPRRQPISHLRARAVLQYIYSKAPNLNTKNFYFTGYGDTQPVASNKTEQGRAMNRRLEVRLMNMQVLTQERARREAFGSTPVPPAPGLTPKMPETPQETPTPEPQK